MGFMCFEKRASSSSRSERGAAYHIIEMDGNEKKGFVIEGRGCAGYGVICVG